MPTDNGQPPKPREYRPKPEGSVPEDWEETETGSRIVPRAEPEDDSGGGVSITKQGVTISGKAIVGILTTLLSAAGVLEYTAHRDDPASDYVTEKVFTDWQHGHDRVHWQMQDDIDDTQEDMDGIQADMSAILLTVKDIAKKDHP